MGAFLYRERTRERDFHMRTKSDVLGELRAMLQDVFVAKSAGGAHARLARAHGYVDGYMRALLEIGVVSRPELLEIVSEEREKVSGPAIREILLIDDPNQDAVAVA
jgi:hypothetical protein